MIVIDRESPNGNAFNILGVAVQLMREKGYTSEQAEAVLEEMKSGDYENLCSVFEQTFCDDVELI
jgi:hypothetical protein